MTQFHLWGSLAVEAFDWCILHLAPDKAVKAVHNRNAIERQNAMLQSLISLILLMVASAPATASPIVIGETVTISSMVMNEQRTINVYLPPEYKNKDPNFPVLYLIDGGLDQDFMHIVGASHLGSIWGRSRPVIIVGVETMDRRNELTGPTSDPVLLEKYPTAGGSAAFRDFLRDEVKPYISANYRTNGDDAVIGESLAGLFIVETYLREPALFGRFAAITPSMWWDNESLAKAAADLLAQSDRVTPPFYISIANEGGEMQSGVDRLLVALEPTAGWCYAPHPQLTHATIYHSTAPEALQFLFPTPFEQDPQSGFDLQCAKKGK